MSKAAAASIKRGLEQALAYLDGAIRAKLKMTQEDFARQFGFSVNTLRHWEQGKRIPEGPTRAYLLVIDRAPKAVTKALRAA
jgi:putative transcriptional regulator